MVMNMFNRCILCFLDFVSISKVRVITVFTVFRLLTDFVCLYNYEFWLSLCKIVRSSVILLLPLSTIFLFDYGNISRVWYSLVFNLSERSCVYGCYRYLFCLYLCDFAIRFWNCSEGVFFFVFCFHFISLRFA